ncbi:2-hydroxyacid dehydrogenase [Acidipila rosea]|uniref:Phosphoglycerate dehydrogenase-like enzyme n=1 Tax=Acidipila rosea TaxID=768535 RepID=A0A4R1KZ65_9BACT|nr:2-hydroxyacid dehydrogenase [Acidipila rosea]TCK70784.1 phosphoglycerate dehydrogenase-like enzyme [Acidipila rosea]
MVRVGVPPETSPELFENFPPEVSVHVLPPKPESPIEIDFWVASVYAAAAKQIVPQLRGVKVVQSLQAGVDWLKPLVPEGAQLCDAQGVHNVATAEWAVAALLAMLKFLPRYVDLQHEGKWANRPAANAYYKSLYKTDHDPFPPVLLEELDRKTVLIVGYGSIGKSIEDRLIPFGCNIQRIARNARPGVEPIGSLHALLPQADAVVLITPLTAETRGLIGAKELALMKQGAVLVNAARGPVVDTGALLDALNNGQIRAALDVTDPEPLPDGHPLWHAPNVLITPHVAGSSPMFMRRAFEFIASQVRRFANGEPLENVVHGEY